MKNKLLIFSVLLMTLVACNKTEENPFFVKWNTPFGVPPFDQIENKHYMPAFEKAIKENRAEIDAIANSTEAPTFANTIEAFEKSGKLLDKVQGVFYNLSGAHTNAEMKKMEKELAPKLSALSDDINLNAKLFQRIKSVFSKKAELKLTSEQEMLLNKIYKGFERGGANLPAEKQDEFRKINAELAKLQVQFGDNVLNATNAFKMYIDKKEDLAGLPAGVVEAAALSAKEDGKDGKWLFTIQKPSLIPFLQYSDKRELREKMFRGYVEKCTKSFDNRKIASKMAALRVKKANLLGFETHANFILDKNMAKNPETVYAFLDKIWEPALKAAKAEVKELQKMIKKEGKNFKLAAWDWWYYAEKLKKAKYDLSEEEIRPYFQLEKVRDGAFEVAKKLFGITFTELTNLPKYHPEVKTFEVKEADGTHIGIFYCDYFPRSSKRGGAWMNSIRKQSGWATKNSVDPVIMNVCNFTKPTATTPSLLSVDEVQTLFHEFGHALHGLLSKCKYNYLSGTSTPRDFVELPSQIMENWSMHPEVLKLYAKHYKTGKVIPQELINKIDKAGKFNQGFITTEYMSAAILDMDWHTMKEAKEVDAQKFEDASLNKMGLIDEIVVRYRSPYFRHIFAGGYSSGYYGYLWAALLDADAFAAFTETDLFNKEVAKKFRENILQKGGTVDAMEMYKNFRGREPQPEALLKRKGFIK
jgi:peptidyl-dipeptidase Dcp